MIDGAAKQRQSLPSSNRAVWPPSNFRFWVATFWRKVRSGLILCLTKKNLGFPRSFLLRKPFSKE
jgi:hypothetical protein